MVQRQNIFEKIENYRKVLAQAIDCKKDGEIRLMLSHCRYYRLGKLKELTGEERALYDLLLQNGLSVRTVYKHFVLLDYPQEVQEMLRNKEISIDGACTKAFSFKKMRGDTVFKQLMTEIRTVIGGLEWKNLNKLTQQI